MNYFYFTASVRIFQNEKIEEKKEKETLVVKTPNYK